MPSKRKLHVRWCNIAGAATKKRILHLQPNGEGTFTCPIGTCLVLDYKSVRGLRKHINNIHPYFYWFDEAPVVHKDDENIIRKQKLKATTHKMPAFSLEKGLGREFLDWLKTPCGGDKAHKDAVQIGRRGMKYLMSCLGEIDSNINVSEEYMDCCLGSPGMVINFMKLLIEDMEVSSSGALSYMKSLSDMMDFRKSAGVSDDTLRSFATTEVYIRRGKENLAKRKKLEYARNLDLESLISRNSWATLEEMNDVLPHHSPHFQHVVQRCLDGEVTISELSFATRLVILFYRIWVTIDYSA